MAVFNSKGSTQGFKNKNSQYIEDTSIKININNLSNNENHIENPENFLIDNIDKHDSSFLHYSEEMADCCQNTDFIKFR